MLSQLLQPAEDSGDDFSDDAQERYTPVVIAITPVFFVLIQRNDVRVSRMLGHTALLPAFGDYMVQWGSKDQKAVLQQIRGNAVVPGALADFSCLMACLSLSMVGSASRSSSGGRLTVASRAEGVTTFCLE